MPYSWKGRDGTQYEIDKVTDQHLLRAHRLFREQRRNALEEVERATTPPSTKVLAWLRSQNDAVEALTEEIQRRSLEALELRTKEQAIEDRKRWDERQQQRLQREAEAMARATLERRVRLQEEQREREQQRRLSPPISPETTVERPHEAGARFVIPQQFREVATGISLQGAPIVHFGIAPRPAPLPADQEEQQTTLRLLRMRQEVEALERRAAAAEKRLQKSKKKEKPKQTEKLGNAAQRSKRKIHLPNED